MSINHKQALNDALNLVELLTEAGWSIMSIGNVHGYSKDNENFTVLSFSVEKRLD